MAKKDKHSKVNSGGTAVPLKLTTAWSIWTMTVPDEINDLVGPLEGDPIELYEDFKTYLRAAFKDQGKNKMIIDDRYTSDDQLAVLCDSTYTAKEVEKIFGLCRIVAIANMARAQRLTKIGATTDAVTETADNTDNADKTDEPTDRPDEGKETEGVEAGAVTETSTTTEAHSA